MKKYCFYSSSLKYYVNVSVTYSKHTVLYTKEFLYKKSFIVVNKECDIYQLNHVLIVYKQSYIQKGFYTKRAFQKLWLMKETFEYHRLPILL